MRILILAAGSHGDVLPFVALAQEFLRRGHDPRLYTSAYFATMAQEAGIPFIPLGTVEEYQGVLKDKRLTHPTQALRVIGRSTSRYIGTTYDTMAADVIPGETIIVCSTLGLVGCSLAQAKGLPTVLVHLAPCVMRSTHRVPRFAPRPPWQGAPRFVKRLRWYLADRLVIDRTIGSAVNRHRVEIGLPAIPRVFHDWTRQADMILGMFPSWFADPQPDWPAALRMTGFPLYDHAQAEPLPPALEAFLDAGAPPVAFTAGTATAAAPEFFATSAEACRRSGRRGILLTRFAEQLPDRLPPDVIHVAYAPFSALLPRVAAFVHHGGIGTTSQAFRAGVPQLIRPMAHDQFDNSDHAQRLGVALELLPRDYRVDRVIASLDRLTGDPALRARCVALAPRVEADGIERSCDYILTAAGPRAVAA